ncbi:MAG: hypothetical protein WKF43_05615 [Acidimicrobiales bacterium]
MAERGRVRDAIALLSEENRRDRSPSIERALVHLRHAGFDQTVDTLVRPRPVGIAPDLETVDGVPRVEPSRLDLASLRRGFDQFGCLFVPGLIPPDRVADLVEGIDHAFDAFDAWQAAPGARRSDEAQAWFTPFQAVGQYAGRGRGGRGYTRRTGGVWTVDSPRMLYELLDTFDRLGLGTLIADHLGERPALSAAKCNLRRTPVHIPGNWHQDGSFLGREVSTIDMWVALSECGRDAPGLDIVPHRFEDLLDTGPDTVVIAHDTVLEAIEELDVGVVSPEFQPGDVLFFDHAFLHRTAIAPGMTRERYALETWFFAPSCYPADQIPLLY